MSNKLNTEFHVSTTFFIELHTQIDIENWLMHKDVTICMAGKAQY